MEVTIKLEKGQMAIIWSTSDFQRVAEDNWEIYRDELDTHNDATKWQDVFNPEYFQEALEAMIENHDCNQGIDNDMIETYLIKHCV